MTNISQRRSSRKNQPQEERDLLLMVVLTFFNFGSGATTILGAIQILPVYLAWTVGGAVQLMLFLLQAGLTAKRTPLRKWLAIIILASASVYTSFFTYYGELAQETNEKRAMDRAIEAHNRLVSEVYTPIKDHLRDLQQEANNQRAIAEAEKQRGITTGEVGYGQQARKLDKLALDKEIKAENFQNTVNELRPLFEYNFEKLEPKDILNNDRKALSSAPQEFRNNYPELKRGDYIDEGSEISLLAPYLKVRNQEEAAFIALLIAVGVDGMAIMLGTAIVTKLVPPEERRSPVAVVGNSIATSIREVRTSFAKVNNAGRESFLAEDEDLQAAVEMVTLNVKGKGSDFLNNFYYAISEIEPHTINYSALTEKYRTDENMHNPIRAFIDKLREPRRAWVVRNNNNTEWVVPPEHYHQLVNWLQKEIKRQKFSEAEMGEEIDFGFGFSELQETPVQFKIPVNPNSN
ncbi:MAG: hypothetical protein F6K54_00425 [Okeania sp. SIO3B5]|uniref:hypothetical protein n=1 Tax=Okeania sp. SIO3B5 TaxID=2607811 RepID=UPI001401B51C|nr:hypothetical protein [Okeania sp. SIO3B5]NEO51695.1 hypothetical protein [Okeania sp. SIO3B5]